jgi:RNA polymerase sigma-70 factor (ECF subfamily)
VIYPIFNEGYMATIGEAACRADLCAEAIRLGRALCELLPREAESLGLLALMLLQDSRRAARVRDRQLITLEEQDRTLWDQSEIAEGVVLQTSNLPVGDGPARVAVRISGGQLKHVVEELILTRNIGPAHPSNLSLPHHVDHFITLNRSSQPGIL